MKYLKCQKKKTHHKLEFYISDLLFLSNKGNTDFIRQTKKWDYLFAPSCKMLKEVLRREGELLRSEVYLHKEESTRGRLSEAKTNNFIFIFSWSNRQKFVQNKKSDNVFRDYSLWISEINDSNGIRDRRRNWEHSVIKYLCYPSRGVVIGKWTWIARNVCCKHEGNH